MKHYYDIKPSERLAGLGFNNAEMKLNYFFEKSKRTAKLKKSKCAANSKQFVKIKIINTQKKDWN